MKKIIYICPELNILINSIMKKIFTTLTIILFFVISANAQTEFGLRGGLNMSNIIGDNVEDNNDYYSFHIGFFTSIKITDNLSIQPEIQYSSQGADYETVFSEGIYESITEGELRFQYLNLPVMVKFNVFKGLFIEVGPQAGYLAYSKHLINYTEKENGDITSRGRVQNNLRKLTNEIDYGVVGGLGYQFKDGLFLEARYYYGLNDIIKDIDENRNSVFQFSVGYKFN